MSIFFQRFELFWSKDPDPVRIRVKFGSGSASNKNQDPIRIRIRIKAIRRICNTELSCIERKLTKDYSIWRPNKRKSKIMSTNHKVPDENGPVRYLTMIASLPPFILMGASCLLHYEFDPSEPCIFFLSFPKYPKSKYCASDSCNFFLLSVKIFISLILWIYAGNPGDSWAGAAVVGEPTEQTLPLHLGTQGPRLLPLLHAPEGRQERPRHSGALSLLAVLIFLTHFFNIPIECEWR